MDNLGVAMNATTLSAYAVAQGMDKAFKDMSNAEKAELAMKYFFEQTSQYAGNFEREATETISGSLGMLSAAWQSFIAGLGNSNADISNLSQNVIDAFYSVVQNITPVIKNMASVLPNVLIEIAPILAEAFNNLWEGLTSALAEKIPSLSWAFENLETIIVSLTAATIAYKGAIAISGLIDTLRKATEGQTLAQTLLNAAMNANPFVLITTLIAGLVAAVVTLWNTNEGFRNAVISAWEAIKTAIVNGAEAIKGFFTETIPNAVKGAIDWFKSFDWANIGVNIIQGIAGGVTSAASKLAQAALDAAKRAFKAVKDFFGINSPSKLMADKIGKYIPAGISVGIDKGTPSMLNTLKNSMIELADVGESGVASMSRTSNVTVNQNFYKERSMTAYEIEREAANGLRRVGWELA